ncbi:hypothetical protein [Curtobacterium sp. MCPF17_052]|uniref:hypothetical protein n=1 Tax=Curtobacterium sp. MCPF17_052 TaxID=2175655 RepID=UPI0024DF9C81|nr:hypothetical protein [Curtobacterium sp. MCPF17_052]WIB14069.1 hypothetical protein DEJ36_15300 [Curtobacterium sp. MCPF17_052]
MLHSLVEASYQTVERRRAADAVEERAARRGAAQSDTERDGLRRNRAGTVGATGTLGAAAAVGPTSGSGRWPDR